MFLGKTEKGHKPRKSDPPYKHTQEIDSVNFAGAGGPKWRLPFLGHGEVRVYRGTGVPRGVRRTTWERSLKNWELQISCFEELLDGENVLGLVPASLPLTLGYACTFYAPTSPPPIFVSQPSRTTQAAQAKMGSKSGLKHPKDLLSVIFCLLPCKAKTNLAR